MLGQHLGNASVGASLQALLLIPLPWLVAESSTTWTRNENKQRVTALLQAARGLCLGLFTAETKL